MPKRYTYGIRPDHDFEKHVVYWFVDEAVSCRRVASGDIPGDTIESCDAAVESARTKIRELEAADKAEAAQPPAPYEVCEWRAAYEDRNGQRLCWYQLTDHLSWFSSYGPGDTDWRPVRLSRKRVAEMFWLVDPAYLEFTGWEPEEGVWQNADGRWQSAYRSDGLIETTGAYPTMNEAKSAAVRYGEPVRPVFGKRGGR